MDNRLAQLDALRSYVASLNNGSYTTPVQVVGVNVEGTGAAKTRPYLLKAHIAPLLQATTVDEVVAAADLVQRSLNSLDIYKDVVLSLDQTEKSQLLAGIVLPTAKRFVAQTGTNFGNGEGSGYIRGTVKNYLGFGEILSVDTSVGTRTKSSTLAQLSVPLAGLLPLQWKGEALGYTSERDIDWAAHKQQIRGVTFRVVSPRHSLGMDAVLRSVYASTMKTTATLRQQAGHSFKLGLFYNWTRDTRNRLHLPTQGSLVKVTNEVAGGDFPFAKSAVEFTRAMPLDHGFSAAFSGKFGLLWPMQSSHVMDRFYLGGPLDIRGFRLNHLGPHDHGDAIGGESLAALGVSLFSKVPRVDNDNLRLHVFLNGGSTRMVDKQRPLTTIKNLLSYPSMSTGIGLVYAHSAARFELNVTMPLTAHAGEGVHKGLQFGVGLSFL